MNFIGREAELNSIDTYYKRDSFEMMILYGRRRIGKSTLLQKFSDGKKTVFFTAIQSSLQDNLDLLSTRITDTLFPGLSGFHFSSIDEAFHFLTEQCKSHRLVFIIDEFPYLAEQYPQILSVMQKYIDTEWQYGKMFLILSGSSVSFMENEVLSEKSPLFGRRTLQLHLRSFNYIDSGKFVPAYSPEDKALCYGITGGVPKYLALLDDSISVHENIQRLFFQKMGYLYEEPSNLLTQEFRNVATYNSIIHAIAGGAHQLNEIVDKTHLNPSSATHAITNMIATGILSKEFSITEESKRKKTTYVIHDCMFSFWYRFVSRGTDLIERDRGNIYYENMVLPYLSDYMGTIFEEMCREYTILSGIDQKLPILVTKVGKWWGTNPKRKEQTDIDVVALNELDHTALLGECKYKNTPVDKSVFDALEARNGLIDHKYRTVGYLLFSKNGFSDWITEHADEKDITLIDLSKMYHFPEKNS